MNVVPFFIAVLPVTVFHIFDNSKKSHHYQKQIGTLEILKNILKITLSSTLKDFASSKVVGRCNKVVYFLNHDSKIRHLW